jgi:hypothetical protein
VNFFAFVDINTKEMLDLRWVGTPKSLKNQAKKKLKSSVPNLTITETQETQKSVIFSKKSQDILTQKFFFELLGQGFADFFGLGNLEYVVVCSQALFILF